MDVTIGRLRFRDYEASPIAKHALHMQPGDLLLTTLDDKGKSVDSQVILEGNRLQIAGTISLGNDRAQARREYERATGREFTYDGGEDE